MKYQYSLIAISLALAGCGGDSSSSSGNTVTPTYDVAGTIASRGTLLDTTVCIDENQNYQCDSNEPAAKSDNAGDFTITSSNKNILTSTILAEVEQGSNLTLRISAPGQNLTTGNVLNAVTTLISGLVVDGKTVEQAEQIIQAQLTSVGISLSDSVMSDATASELNELEQNTQALLISMQPAQMTQSVALLAQNLTYQNKSLATILLSEAEASAFAQELDNTRLQSVGSNDTGVTLHFSDTDSDQVQVQSSFPGQDAQYGFDKTERQTATGSGFKFVKLDANGEKLSAEAVEWSCTLDERTGLVWENKNSDTNSIQFKDRTFVFESESFRPYYEDLEAIGCATTGDNICSTSQYSDYINSQSLCGINTWRIPTYQEFYDLLDLGETAKDENDNVYGLNVTYFPHQGKGSPDVESGAIWLDDFSFNNYSVYNYQGALQFPVIATKGADRGYVSFVEIYSDQVERETGTSYQFPIRLVAVMEQ